MPEIYHRFSHPKGEGFRSENPSLTQQNFKSECDINEIIRRSVSTGFLVDPLRPRGGGSPMFGDFSSLPDLQVLRQKMIDAEAEFMSLPAKLRKRFQNDSSEFVKFCLDPENISELEKLGLATVRKQSPEPEPEPKP